MYGNYTEFKFQIRLFSMQTPKWCPDLGFYIFNLYGEQGLIKYPLSCVASAVA